jgi:hypothetical protein
MVTARNFIDIKLELIIILIFTRNLDEAVMVLKFFFWEVCS